MYIHYSLFLVIILFITCNNYVSFDKVELLKNNLLKIGFQSDSAFNKYREYSWKVKKDSKDSILVREAEYFITDTVCYDSYCRYIKSMSLHLYEYQLFPDERGVYLEENFPTFYERERNCGMFFNKFSNYKKGLRHLGTDSANLFQSRVVLHNRYILFVAKMEDRNYSDTSPIIDILKKLKDGILEQRSEDAQLIYSLLKDNDLIKKNLYAYRWYSENVNNADTNKPPMETENDLLRKDSLFSKEYHCRCLDVCTENDGCIQGGYIYVKVLNSDGSPAVDVECILRHSRREKFKNVTDKYGIAGWCRVKKNENIVEIFNKNEIKRVVPSWDTIPRIMLVEF